MLHPDHRTDQAHLDHPDRVGGPFDASMVNIRYFHHVDRVRWRVQQSFGGELGQTGRDAERPHEVAAGVGGHHPQRGRRRTVRALEQAVHHRVDRRVVADAHEGRRRGHRSPGGLPRLGGPGHAVHRRVRATPAERVHRHPQPALGLPVVRPDVGYHQHRGHATCPSTPV